MHIWNNAMFQQIKSSFTKLGQVKNDTNQSFYLNAVTSNIENELKTSNPSSNLPWRTNLNIWFPSTTFDHESAPLKSRGTEGCQGQHNIKASKRMIPLHNYGQYCPESASTRNGGTRRLPGRNLQNTGKENFYIHLLAILLTEKDNVIIKMFLLF